jgi:hypothetical protein
MHVLYSSHEAAISLFENSNDVRNSSEIKVKSHLELFVNRSFVQIRVPFALFNIKFCNFVQV